jgi:5'-3' exonuclease
LTVTLTRIARFTRFAICVRRRRPTNAIYGFVKMLAKMRAAIGPTHLIVVWDGG